MEVAQLLIMMRGSNSSPCSVCICRGGFAESHKEWNCIKDQTGDFDSGHI
jgi:hypothetical protein